MADCISAIKSEVKDKKARYRIYRKIIVSFKDADCDTLCECEGEDPEFDAALSDS